MASAGKPTGSSAAAATASAVTARRARVACAPSRARAQRAAPVSPAASARKRARFPMAPASVLLPAACVSRLAKVPATRTRAASGACAYLERYRMVARARSRARRARRSTGIIAAACRGTRPCSTRDAPSCRALRTRFSTRRRARASRSRSSTVGTLASRYRAPPVRRGARRRAPASAWGRRTRGRRFRTPAPRTAGAKNDRASVAPARGIPFTARARAANTTLPGRTFRRIRPTTRALRESDHRAGRVFSPAS